MKKIVALLLALVMVAALGTSAFAVNEDVEGPVTIYTSMYPFVIKMMNEAIAKEFPNLEPVSDDGFFFYAGTGKLIEKIYGEMGADKNQPLGCDMFMVAEPAFSLELKEYGYLHSFEVEDAENKLRFPYDSDGYWYPIRVCNMVLAYNPLLEKSFEEKGIKVPRTFKDFAFDTNLKGYINMGNPATSGTAYAGICSLLDTYGPEYLDALGRNAVTFESGSQATARLQSGESVALMILEESILKEMHDNEEKGISSDYLEIIYPEDGVILIPSTVMIVAEEKSSHVNTEACEAIAQWLMTEEAQKLILEGYMHSVLAAMDEYPVNSVETNSLIEKDLGVDWVNAYKNRQEIMTMWNEKVTTK